MIDLTKELSTKHRVKSLQRIRDRINYTFLELNSYLVSNTADFIENKERIKDKWRYYGREQENVIRFGMVYIVFPKINYRKRTLVDRIRDFIVEPLTI
ncbi:hypothetical protein HZA96_06610 [Candidatus Woesearchaeota archaeon]|nr:hypothetical protein [Candidatus Woesearchaeota archaeon]